MLLVLLIALPLLHCDPLNYEAPDDCQYYQSSSNSVSLTCQLRTINSEFDTTNFSVIPSEHTTTLTIKCDPNLRSRSQLDDRSFVHLSKLRALEVRDCKLSEINPKTFAGLRDLRNLTVKTFNTNWPAMNLGVKGDSFANVRQLERLDLSANNIWSFPGEVFCPLLNLAHLNVSQNRLQDVGDLGFREFLGPFPTGNGKKTGCSLDVQVLDSSFNHFVLLPTNGFAVLRRLTELYVNDNEISLVADRALGGLKNLQILDLSNNKVVALPAETFKETKSVKEIYLRNNSLSVLAPGLFANLEHLLALDLSQNSLSSSWINPNTFSGLIRLVLLNLSQNKLSQLDGSFFKDLYTLQILNLEHNHLEAIPADSFAPMSNLHTLLLSYNQIAYLDAYSLNELFVLSLLSLDNNQLSGIHPEGFRNCSSLQDLNLNSNKLKAVPLALQNMQFLRTVDLGENQIEQIEPANFKGMTNLYGLRLIGNRLTRIWQKTFENLGNLQILNLARNLLTSIERDSFAGNPNLQAVRLDANNLTEFGPNLFENLSKLLWLNVSANAIEIFDYKWLPSHLQWLDLHGNHVKNLGVAPKSSHLKSLDASFNQLTQIEANSLPESLEVVFLNDNEIREVEANSFVGLANLSRVDLYANQIVSLDLNALRLKTVDLGRNLPEFYIGGNPFECDCSMEWLQRINKLDLRQHPRVMDLEAIYCKLRANRELHFLPLVEAESSQFLCSYKTHCFALCTCCEFDACDCEMTCPQNCTCYHDQSWSANLVDCSAAGYANLPTKIPMDATELYLDGNRFGEVLPHSFIGRKNLQVLFVNHSEIRAVGNLTFSGLRRLRILHLEHNAIGELLGDELVPLVHLQELYLQHNLLKFIGNRTFSPLKYLEVLDLSDNFLTLFDVWQLGGNPYLVDIDLGGNPWSCNCRYMKKFANWLQINAEKVRNSPQVACNFSQVFLLSNSSSCSTFAKIVEVQVMHDYLPVMLVAMCGFLASVVCVCGAFYYRRELRVWIYSRCGLRMCYKTTAFEEQQDKDRLFDAYISYSVKDEGFVAQVLAPGLEERNNDNAAVYRLCLHYRDFNVSAYVADTIIEAVESSRRTIIVLSKNFLQNEWCRFEFKSALHEVLKDRRRRLIFVVSGELPQRDLDPDLRLYLKTNTVIEWGDRQFWQKLQFAMPDVVRRGGMGVACVHQGRGNIYATAGDEGGHVLGPLPPQPKFLGGGSLPREMRGTLPHPLWA